MLGKKKMPTQICRLNQHWLLWAVHVVLTYAIHYESMLGSLPSPGWSEPIAARHAPLRQHDGPTGLHSVAKTGGGGRALDPGTGGGGGGGEGGTERGRPDATRLIVGIVVRVVVVVAIPAAVENLRAGHAPHALTAGATWRQTWPISTETDHRQFHDEMHQGSKFTVAR